MQEIVKATGQSYGSVVPFLSNLLAMRNLSSKLVSHLFYRCNRLATSKDCLALSMRNLDHHGDSFLKCTSYNAHLSASKRT